MLCLPAGILIVGVRHVERRVAKLDIDVQRIDVVWMHVQPIEERLTLPVVVKGLEFRGIEEAIRPQPAEGQEVSDRVAARSEVDLAARALEGAVSARDAADWLRLVETGFGDDPYDEAVLVAEFGGRDARDDFHRLDGFMRNLIRINAALPIGHRLVVDRELRLCVVADRMEEAVGIRHHAGRRHGNDLIQAGRGLEGQLRDQALIDVGVGRRIALEELFGMADDVDRSGRARQPERQVDVDRNRRSYVDVALECLETLCGNADVVRVRRQIAEHVLPHGIRCGRPTEPRDRITDCDFHRLHYSTRRVLHRALHGPGPAEFLTASVAKADHANGDHHLQRN
jgi:hypothetical protein